MALVRLLWEMFKGPLAVLTAPAVPLLFACSAGIAAMTILEFRKK